VLPEYKQVLVQEVESVIPNSLPVILNNVSQEHAGWFTFAEIETKHFVTNILENESICFDVGANIGMYSLLFLQQSPNSRVFAFEPSSNYRFLERNIPAKFKMRFFPSQIALGDKDGIYESEIWESFGHNRVKDNFNFSKLDTYLLSHPVDKIDILKIDTDGFETQILDGAVKTLLRFKPLTIVESDMTPGSCQNSGVICVMLNGLGYVHLGTLDGNNEIYAHQSDSRMAEFKQLIRRSFIVNRTFLAALNNSLHATPTHVLQKNIRFTSNTNLKVFFQKLLRTSGIPWSYIVTSSIIDGETKFLRISGLVLGADLNLICISDNVPTIFSLPLLKGLYINVLVPVKNVRQASNMRIVVRNAGRTEKALVLGLRIDLLA
jgi:FkbM family methyltransferase